LWVREQGNTSEKTKSFYRMAIDLRVTPVLLFVKIDLLRVWSIRNKDKYVIEHRTPVETKKILLSG
jgi:hypothetical protein